MPASKLAPEEIGRGRSAVPDGEGKGGRSGAAGPGRHRDAAERHPFAKPASEKTVRASRTAEPRGRRARGPPGGIAREAHVGRDVRRYCLPSARSSTAMRRRAARRSRPARATPLTGAHTISAIAGNLAEDRDVIGMTEQRVGAARDQRRIRQHQHAKRPAHAERADRPDLQRLRKAEDGQPAVSTSREAAARSTRPRSPSRQSTPGYAQRIVA